MDESVPESAPETDSVEIKEINIPNYEESIVLKTIRLIINLLTNVIIFFTVYVTMVFACRNKIGIFELHIILSVLGYQFFMCQGVLVLSRHNSWSVHLRRQHRRHFHWSFLLIGTAMVTAGSVMLMLDMPKNFQTPHGILGTLAFSLSLLSLLNGLSSYIAPKVTNSMTCRNLFKYFHAVTGVGSLFLAAASLCFGFDNRMFRLWANDDVLVVVLMTFTLIFTVLVALDLWIMTINKIFCKR